MTGLLVNSKQGPNVSRKRRDKVRAAIFALRVSGVTGDARDEAEESIRGRIQHVRQFNPGSAKRLLRSLDLALKQAPDGEAQRRVGGA